MATLQKKIAETFLKTLEDSKQFNSDQINQLRQLLADNKKLKADDLVRLFAVSTGGEVK